MAARISRQLRCRAELNRPRKAGSARISATTQSTSSKSSRFVVAVFTAVALVVAAAGPRWVRDFCSLPSAEALKVVNIHYKGEFGYELLAIVPFAYYKFLRGELGETVGCGEMKQFYFFNPKHRDDPDCKRRYKDLPKALGWKWGLHGSPIPKTWVPPPVARHHRCKPSLVQKKEDKPFVVISNKYTMEFNEPPHNFIDVDTLRSIISMLLRKFTVIYNRPASAVTQDNSKLLDFGDFDMIEKDYGDSVILMGDIARQSGLSYNEAQARVMSHCSYFISVQGGNSILASFFGGRNIVQYKYGAEVWYNSFNRLYPFLNRQWLTVVHNGKEMEQAVDKMVARRLVAPNEEFLDYETVARGLQGCDRDYTEFE